MPSIAISGCVHSSRPAEVASVAVTETIALASRLAGPELVRFPIHDPRTPDHPVAYRAVVIDLVERIRGGQFVAIACRGKIGRAHV